MDKLVFFGDQVIDRGEVVACVEYFHPATWDEFGYWAYKVHLKSGEVVEVPFEVGKTLVRFIKEEAGYG